jgi:hypothetical protein
MKQANRLENWAFNKLIENGPTPNKQSGVSINKQHFKNTAIIKATVNFMGLDTLKNSQDS